MPDVKSSVQSLTVTGEDMVDIEGQKIACWIVEQRFGPIALESQQTRVEGAVLKMWIDKQRGLTSANRLTAKLRLLQHIGGGGYDAIVRDSLSETQPWIFRIPCSSSIRRTAATETKDWTLPGVTKPDVLGETRSVVSSESARWRIRTIWPASRKDGAVRVLDDPEALPPRAI